MTREAIRTSAAHLTWLLIVGSVHTPAQADLWSLDSRVESRLEHNNNYRLEPAPTVGVSTLVVTGGLSAARQTEVTDTRLLADLSVYETWPRQQRSRSALFVDLRQSVNLIDGSWMAHLRHVRESTADKLPQASEVGLGRVERITDSADLNGSRALDERTSARLGVTGSRTRFDEQTPTATGFQQAAASAGMSHRLTELDTLSVQLDRGAFRAELIDAASYQTSVSASWQRTLSDNDSFSLSVGGYRSAARSVSDILVCPLPVAFCRGGLVSPIVAQQVGRSRSSGTLFDALLSRRLDERTQVSVAASRRLTAGSAAAISSSDAASVNISHAIAPSLTATGSSSYSRARFIGGNATTPQVRGLALGLTQSFSPDVSVALDVQHSRSQAGSAGPAVEATVFAVTLRVQTPQNRLSR